MLRRALLLSLAALVGTRALAQTEDVAQARPAVDRWLAIVDTGDQVGAWQSAGTRFKATVTAEEWMRSANAVRGPLGAVRQRSAKAAQSHKTLPGMPDGAYVVVEFDTVFAHKAAAVETVTAVREPDGVWRVIGYFVR